MELNNGHDQNGVGTGRALSLRRGGFKTRPYPVNALHNILDAIIFRHTIFSLPLVISAIFLETHGHLQVRPTILILLAAICARNAANAMNRVIDADIDWDNVRTRGRQVPQGLVSKKTLIVLSLMLVIIAGVCAAMLNTLCIILFPFAIIFIVLYSFSKRWTWLCHYWLGAACAIAPMGAFIGISGRFSWPYLVLAGAHCFWVAGFDIIYALQDIVNDRQHGLYSIPAEFGEKKARVIAFASHIIAIILFFLLPSFWSMSKWYYAAAAIAACLVLSEHIISRGSTRHITIASYSINEIVPLVILAGVILGIFA
ncbi:MAG: putative 4-hydroxybenzoate polyprenyltransferase [Spirochaetaceae bacterium]|jgi:4-hydroxybenzoate polyprenyltransferase|nr:putative 4-hydroxybenzoate polyprenyltransferase [Spirochaetaceae bacterium]